MPSSAPFSGNHRVRGPGGNLWAVSHAAISEPQFHEQLKMFMTPQELIAGTHKVDSRFFDTRHDPGRTEQDRSTHTPTEQWEAPNSSKYGGNRGVTLRREKQNDLEQSQRGGGNAGWLKFHREPFATMPPIELQYWHDEHRPTMMQGHHRLAHAETQGISHLAVTYRPDHDRSQVKGPVQWLRGTIQ